jgi:two-component system chemotaxis response regulator CheY
MEVDCKMEENNILNDVTVLVCDDSILARKKVKDCLKAMGCINIFEAADGQQAIDFYKEKRPDVVFMDIIMPKVEGIEALKAILAINPSAKVIMASSVGTQAYLTQAIEAGACNFIQKPFEFEQVEKIITKIL